MSAAGGGYDGDMKPYAELPSRRTAQLIADLLVAVMVYLFVRLGLFVHGLIARLGEPGRALEEAGRAIADTVERNSDGLTDLPLLGQALAELSSTLAAGGQSLAEAGAVQRAAVDDVAVTLGVLVAVVPITLLLAAWLRRRVASAREAAAAARLRDEGADLALFALRALARRPLPELRSAAADPLAAYGAGRVEELAALELTALGLRPPGPARGHSSASGPDLL